MSLLARGNGYQVGLGIDGWSSLAVNEKLESARVPTQISPRWEGSKKVKLLCYASKGCCVM